MAKLFQTCNLCGGDQTVKAHSDNGEVSLVKCTFEHITNPRDLLVTVRRILVQRGVVAITVPNYEFITTTLGRCLSKKPFNKVASVICHRGHLYYYMPATMAKFFDALGFETLEMCYSYAWVPLIEKAKHLEDPLRKTLARLTCLVNDFCENLHLWRNFTGIGRKTNKVRPTDHLKDTVFLKMPETGSLR